MKQIFKSMFILIALVFAGGLNAQELRVLEGKVVNEQGSPLAGVTVAVKEDNRNQTQTNSKGEFTLKAISNQIIVVEYIGYETVEMPVSDVSKSPIKLKEDILSLSEVVVLGYGSVKKSDLTGSVGTVSVSDMTKAPVMSVEEMLAGRVAGLQVTSNSGQPGDDFNIVIRGGNSLTQDNSPLFVVDGMPVEGFDLGSLSPNDIESISVLKDASSTAIYGARGANGVIVITTKQGKLGAGILYDGFFSISEVSKKMDVLSPYEFVKYEMERAPTAYNKNKYLTNVGFTSIDEYKDVPAIDWQDHLFRGAKSHIHNLSFRNNTEKGDYLVSGNFARTEGVIINSGRSREKVRGSFRQNLFKNLKFSNQLFYSHDRNWGSSIASAGSTSDVYLSYVMSRVWAYRPMSLGGSGDNLLDELYDLDEGASEDAIYIANMNPIITTQNEIRNQDRNTIFFNAALEYKLAKGFEFIVRGGYMNKMIRNEAFYNSKTIQGRVSPYNPNGQNGFVGDRKLVDWSNEYLLNYRFSNSDHELDAVAGVTFSGTNLNTTYSRSINSEYEKYGIQSISWGTPSTITVDKTKNTLQSYLGRVNYSYKSKYLATAAMRADGSSKFNPASRWGYFPSGAVAYNLAKEDFLIDSKIISEAKFRASYGITGNNRLPDFARDQSVSLDDFYSITSGSDFMRVVQVPSDMGNGRLRWEQTEQTDFGLDLSLFNNRVNFVFDVYRKKTKDLILKANLPRYSGFASGYLNVGSVENKGLEFSFNSINVNSGDFLWTSNFNISFNRNKVLSLNVGEENLFSTVNFAGSNWAGNPLYVASVGQAVGQFYGLKWDGNYQFEDFDYDAGTNKYTLKAEVTTNGTDRQKVQPGDIKYIDQNGDLIVNADDFVPLGSALPKHFGGFQNNFSYKNVSLSVFLQWNYGNKIMNANRIFFEGNPGDRGAMNQFATYADRWTPENPSDEYYRVGGGGPVGFYSDRTLEDGSYLRLRTVQLAFTFPKHWIRQLNRVQAFVSGQNLFTWSNYSGLDPEVSVRNTVLTPGFDYSAYARSKVYAFGLKVEI